MSEVLEHGDGVDGVGEGRRAGVKTGRRPPVGFGLDGGGRGREETDNGSGPPPGGPGRLRRSPSPQHLDRSDANRYELVKLRRRVRTLADEAEIARRLAAFDERGRQRERVYRFIAIEAANFPVATLCRVARVSRSAYYAWAAKGEGPDDALVEEAVLANRIYDIWRSSRRRYGAPRVTAALWRAGQQVNEKKVARLMGELGVAGICGRRKVRTTTRDPSHRPAEDLVERDFSADRPDELWVGDVTYIPTDEGWLYVASVLDVFSRRLVGWSIASHLRTELCLDALGAAAATRGRARFAGTVFHSDYAEVCVKPRNRGVACAGRGSLTDSSA